MNNLAIPAAEGRADDLAQIERLAQAAGVTLPKAYVTAALEHRQTRARARIALESRPRALAEAVIAALEADRDLTTDEQVAEAVAHQMVAATRDDVIRSLKTAETALAKEHAPAIVKACGKAAQTAYEALHEAALVAPGLGPATTPERVLTAAAPITAAWTAARDAQARLKSLTSLLRGLPGVRVQSDDEYLLHLEPRAGMSRAARKSEWDAALDGETLSWCGDLAGFRERVKRATDIAQGHTDAQRKAEIDARRAETEPVLKIYADAAKKAR